MAEFFDDRQEVLDFELTEWGKYLFSIGKLKPVKYAFFDDDILYDINRASGSSEEQKDARQRILNETPRLKAQTRRREAKNYFREYDQAASGPPSYANPLDSLTNITLREQIMQNQGLSSQDRVEKELLLSKMLGTSRTQQDKSPAFNVRLLKNSISSSVQYLSSSHGIQEIPQLDVDIEYKVTVGNTFDGVFGINEDLLLRTDTLGDGTFLAVESDFLLLDITEENTDFESTNFSFEVMKVEDSGTLQYKTFKFPASNDGVDKDGFLVEKRQSSIIQQFDINDAGYYFNISYDSDIEEDLLCGLISDFKDKSHNLKLNYDLECKDVQKNSDLDIYNQEGVKITNCPESD